MSENKSYDSSNQFNQKNESQKHCILWDKKKVQVSINKVHDSCKGGQCSAHCSWKGQGKHNTSGNWQLCCYLLSFHKKRKNQKGAMPSSKKQSLQHISLFKNQQPILRKQGLTSFSIHAEARQVAKQPKVPKRIMTVPVPMSTKGTLVAFSFKREK